MFSGDIPFILAANSSGPPEPSRIERELNKLYKWFKYKKNDKDTELIGVKGITGIIVSSEPENISMDIDTTSRSDAARIRFDVDSLLTFRDAALRGKPVLRLSGDEGYIHDAFVDREDLLRSGERKFELGNNYIVTTDQVSDLADFWQKRAFGKLHTYQLTLSGTRYWYELGEWYTLQIGTAGDVEYIDSTVQLESIDVQKSSTDLGSTTLVFREVYEGWKRDSTPLTRLIASGTVFDKRSSKAGVVTVGSPTSIQICDFYCDGTADDVQIQKAIDVLDGQSGGMVLLTNGTFTLDASLTIKTNVVVSGSGPQTVLYYTSAIDAVTDTGYTDGAIEACTIRYGGTNEIENYLINSTGSRFKARGLVLDHPRCLGVALGGAQAGITGCDLTGGKTSVSMEWGDEYEFDSAETSFVSLALIDDTHFIVTYSDYGNSDYGTAVIGTISGTTISYGSEYVFNSAFTTYTSVAVMDSSHFVVAYRDIGNSNYGTAIVGTISGDTISYGSEHVFNSAALSSIDVASIDDTRFVVAYRDAGNLDYGTAIIGTISGTTISYGSEHVFNSATTNYISVEVVDDTRLVVVYSDDGSARNGTAIIGTISGTTISYGSEYVFSSSTYHLSASLIDSTRFAVTYRDNGNSDYGTAVIGTISGTTISYGSEHVFNRATTNYTSVAAIDSSHFAVAYQDEGNSDYGTAVIGTVFGDFISFSDSFVYNEETSSYNSATESVIAYGGTTGNARVISFELPHSYSIKSSGNNNTVSNNQIYGTDGKFIEAGIYSSGVGDIITNNHIVGEDNERILYGIITDDDCERTQVLGNTIRNVSETAVVIQGTNVKVSDITAFDNGNLIDRGNCESNVAPMIQGEVTPSTSNCTWERNDEQASDGTYSYKLTVTSGGTAAYASLTDSVTGTTDMHGLIAGLTYRLEADVYLGSTGSPAYSEVNLRWGEYYSATWNTTDIEPETTTDEWQTIENEITINEDTTGIYIEIYINSSAASSEYIYVDNIKLIPVGIHNEHSQQFIDLGQGTQV